ncbi:MAG: nitroreductase family protein [Anaerolineae bacterium]|nr:nitroreductase family protein [Anaerolineae bacterium]
MIEDRRIAQLQTIFARRSIRQYTDQPVPRPLIEQVLTAAVWAASSHNRQPWRFAVVTDAAIKQRLAEAMGAQLRRDLAADGVDEAVIARDAERSYARITGAPAVIMVCLTMRDMDTYADQRRSLLEQHMAVQSTAMAGMNLLLAAHDVGLGACWMCAPLFCSDVARAVLELPEDWQPQGLVTLGYPAEIREKTRRPLEESVLWR